MFHGNTEGAQHVAMYLGGGRSYSFGSNPPGERAGTTGRRRSAVVLLE